MSRFFYLDRFHNHTEINLVDMFAHASIEEEKVQCKAGI